jgi:ribose transport system substrate-binding protein
MRFRYSLVAALCALSAGALAACGSSNNSKSDSSAGSSKSGSTGGSFAKYQAAVKKGESPATWNGPTDPVKVPPGKKLTVVTCTRSLEGCKLLTDGTIQAAKSVGWSGKYINVEDPTKYDGAIQTAIAQGADAVAIVGIDAKLIPGGIKAAHAKKVPLVSIYQYNVPGPDGVDAEVSPDANVEGQLLADSMIVNEKGKVNALFLNTDEFSLPVHVLAATKKELEACSECDVNIKTVNFATTTIGTTLSGRAVAALRSDPSINTLLIGFDPPAALIIPAIHSAGLQDKVKMYSQLGTTGALGFVDKKDVLAADVGASNLWGGYAAFDTILRLMNGQKATDENIPAVLMSPTSQNLPPAGQPYVGDSDAHFTDKYKALWQK